MVHFSHCQNAKFLFLWKPLPQEWPRNMVWGGAGGEMKKQLSFLWIIIIIIRKEKIAERMQFHS